MRALGASSSSVARDIGRLLILARKSFQVWHAVSSSPGPLAGHPETLLFTSFILRSMARSTEVLFWVDRRPETPP